ncbi:MAG: L-ribulokinase [Firmicutes bacterium]|nr:L-ribulokinase [Bacillota bacterium]
MIKYALGVDYGTESGRAVLISLADGTEAATAVCQYRHGVMDQSLPDGTPLDSEWALQHPADYLEVLEQTIPNVLAESGIKPEQVVGLGIAFTACTMLPTDAQGTALCFKPELANRPHAWVKLWKHHAAQDEANRLNACALERGETWLARYGGKISAEWLIPKIWQILNEDPEIYAAAGRFIEATDWVIWQLTGVETRNSCTAGYKGIYWDKQSGYPTPDFFRSLDPRLERVVEEKLSRNILPLGSRAGGLTPQMAARLGLLPGTAVAVGNVDAHAALPACGVTAPGKLVMAMGTSICHTLLSSELHVVPGMCGVVEDGILPGYYGYEAGQSAVGDIFAWFVEHAVPARTHAEAAAAGKEIHAYLEEKASALRPGESGLLALDWWNGNRSVLVDTDLTGLMLGYTLLTEPHEVYRALIEATAFGTRTIIDNFTDHGVAVDELYACGGLPEKNRLLMQIYADVTGRTIHLSASKQTPALGAAMFGAVAAGAGAGGYDTIEAAARSMAHLADEVFRPIPDHVARYEQLYQQYRILHDYFGRGANDVMKVLKELKADAR